MVAILLIGCVLANVLQSVFTKEYNKVTECSSRIYALFSAVISLIFFLIRSNFQLDFDTYTVFCALFCGIGAIGSMVGFSQAVRYGPLSISGLIQIFSLAVPTLYGVLMLKEPMGDFTFIGILLLVASLFLTNLQKESSKINLKWVFWISVSFVGNSLFATVQKIHQINEEGSRANELMVLELLVVVTLLLLYVCFFERADFTRSFKRSYFAVGHGLMNAVNNMGVLLLAPIASASLVYPFVTGGDLVIVAIISRIFYKEKLLKRQWIGVALGIVSAVLLSL